MAQHLPKESRSRGGMKDGRAFPFPFSLSLLVSFLCLSADFFLLFYPLASTKTSRAHTFIIIGWLSFFLFSFFCFSFSGLFLIIFFSG